MSVDLNLEMKGRNVKVVVEASVPDLISGFGRYQLFQCSLALIPIIFTAISNTNFVFSTAATKYRCVVPECETTNISSFPPRWWPPEVKDYKCSRPVFANNFSCNPDELNTTEKCHDWVYEDNHSVVTEFQLACQEFKRTLISTIHNLGVLVGMPMIGYISDRWGRKKAIILNCVCLCIGALKTLTGAGASGYAQYVTIEFFEAALVTGAYTSSYVLLVELIGTDKRIIASTAMGFAISAGEIILACVVWNVPYWRHFQLILYCPGIIFLLYCFCLEDSMRWLLTNGRNKEAVRLLKKIAKWNRFVVPEKLKDENYIGLSDVEKDSKEEFHVKLLFKYPAILKRLLVCAWWWLSISMVYYGLTFSSVALPGNKYTNFILSALASIPGELLATVLLNRIGRKKTFIGGCLISGVCNIVIAFVPRDQNVAQIVIFLAGKLFITCCFNVLYTYTSELMPTSARASLVGTCSMVARVGSVLSPLVLLLVETWVALPSILFGCATLLSAMLALTMPETLHHELPDTMAQATALS